MKKNVVKKLETKEKRLLGRMQRTPWTARITNEGVLRRTGMEKIDERYQEKTAPVLGTYTESWRNGKELLAGGVEGSTARRRQREKFIEILMENMNRRWSVIDNGVKKGMRSMVAYVT